MVKSAKTTMFPARTVRYACLLCQLVKHCPSDDNGLAEKIVINPHLEPLDLPGELIILIILLSKMLRTKICSEIGVREQRH